jgi:hypothetical protein
MKNKKRIPAIRLLSHDQFQRLTLDQKLTYLASAFQALMKRQLRYPFILQHDPDRRKSPRAIPLASRSLPATKRGRKLRPA